MRCFPPDAVFQRSNGEYVRAAHLRKAGGDILLGPKGVQVQVQSAVTHAPTERDFVRLQTAEGSIVVTADHELLVAGPDGRPQDQKASTLVHRPIQLYNGSEFNDVIKIEQYKRSTQVVELCFQNLDAAVLAWTFPGRAPRSVRQGAAVACMGKRISSGWYGREGLRETSTFLDVERTCEATRRSRSEGAPADPCSTWSVGSIHHPHCVICPIHARYVRASEGKPACKHGAGCWNCHAPHNDKVNSRRRVRHRTRRHQNAGDSLRSFGSVTDISEVSGVLDVQGSTPANPMLSATLLVLVDLDVLVHRSLVGELLDVKCAGYDGSGKHAPFYCCPGASEFLQFLANASDAELLAFALVTRCARFTCDPILNYLRKQAALSELPQCFDVVYAVDHEDGLMYPDGDRVQKQFDVHRLSMAWVTETGGEVDEGRVVLIHSNCEVVRRQDEPFAFLLPLFCLDEIVDPALRSQASQELKEAQNIVQGALIAKSLADYLACQPRPARKPRPCTEQYENPPPLAKSPDRREQDELLKVTGDWLCAAGVDVKGAHLTSGSPTWAGARFTHSVCPGERGTVVIKDHSDITLRVGWATSQTSQVGTDQWSWGFGATGKSSHANQFKPYGRPFGQGNTVTSIVDRTGDVSTMEFLVDGIPCSDTPAFTVEAPQLEGPLYFAVFGRPGFEFELLSYDVI